MNWILLLLGGAAAFFIVRMLLLARPGLPINEATAAVKAGRAVLIDVREPAEWRSGVAQSAALLPLSDLRGPRAQWSAFLDQHRDKRLLLYCATGSRSGVAAAQLRKTGFDAVNVGSIRLWSRVGWPVVAPDRLD